MKTLHIDFPVWNGDTVYAIIDSEVQKYVIRDIYYNLKSTHHFSGTENLNCDMDIVLNTGKKIKEKDINTIYFTDKNELLKKIVGEI